MIPVIAIYDIGKTNKKFFLLDESYKIVLERTSTFNEMEDEDGEACDDLPGISSWVKETLDEILLLKKFDVKAINFSTYGASLVYINEKGEPVTPLYNYLKKYPEELKKELYSKYGGVERISCETASPELGSLNSGMQLFRIMKESPDVYEKIKHALHLPQYISYLISKKVSSDITSVGCHTQLWDFQKNDYHDWVKEAGLVAKLAPIMPSDQTVEIELAGKKVHIGSGLHDSSAALIPYLTVFSEPFILLSTGTWCISLNPFNSAPLTPDELKKDCLCYMDFKGKPIKASRLFAGYEHEQQTKWIAKHFDKPVDYYKEVRYDGSLISSLKNKVSFSNACNSGSLIQHSMFSERDLNDFRNYSEAYHCLMYDIIQLQYLSTNLVIQDSGVKRIFVDGGFSKNSVYMHLLAQVFPHLEIYAASVAQATAMGAALAIHRHWNPAAIPADMVKLEYYKISEEIDSR